jgi:hypothetical protein
MKANKGVKIPKNVVYHTDDSKHPVNIYSASLGAVHLAYFETKQEAADLVKQATALYKADKDYKHLIVPMNSEIFARLGY